MSGTGLDETALRGARLRRSPHTAPAPARALAALRREVAALRRENAALRARLAGRADTPAPPSDRFGANAQDPSIYLG
jgi:hypothetical protein